MGSFPRISIHLDAITSLSLFFYSFDFMMISMSFSTFLHSNFNKFATSSCQEPDHV